MAINTNGIVTRGECNSISSGAGFSGELDKCPTKSEINATKKLIVLETGLRSNNWNLDASYEDNQLVKHSDVGHYVECSYSYTLPGEAYIAFHKDGYFTDDYGSLLPSSTTESFYAFQNSASNGSGVNDIGLTSNFFDDWTSDTMITLSYGASTTSLTKANLNGYAGTKSDNGEFFKWGSGDSSYILSRMLNNHSLSVGVSDSVDPVYTQNFYVEPSSYSIDIHGTKELTATYAELIDGVVQTSGFVTTACTWTSSDSTNVSVGENTGVIMGMKAGSTARITASYTNSNGQPFSDFCDVTVNQVTTYTVSGKVTDTNGEPVIGATVMIKGTTIGTSTDIEGDYILSNLGLDNFNNGTLVFSYIGYVTQEIAINGKNTIDVTLLEQTGEATLESIAFDRVACTSGQGGYSYPNVIATYSDSTTKNVTSSCTFTITDSSTSGVCNWNSTANTLSHGAIGTATLNASYTEGSITKTATVPVETVKTIPTNVYLTPSSVSVAVGETVTVDVAMDLNNGYTGAVPTEEQISISYVNTGENYIEASLSGNTISVKGKAVISSGAYLAVYVTYNEVTITTQLVVEVTEGGNNDTNIIMTISNLKQIITAKYADGLDERLTFVNGNGNTVDVGLTYDLYYFEGSYDNTVSGPASAWQKLYDSYFNDIYLYDYEEIISETLEDSNWDTIVEAINEAKSTGEEQAIQIDWPMKTITGTTYELEITPSSNTIEVGKSIQLTAEYWTVVNGNRTTSVDVTNSSDCSWQSSNISVASVNKGLVTGNAEGDDIEITATYSGKTDVSYVHVTKPETISIPITLTAEGWQKEGAELDITISLQLFNDKTKVAKAICSNKHIAVGYATGVEDFSETLATVEINADEKSDWSLQMWGTRNSTSSGTFSMWLVSGYDKQRYYQILSGIDTDTDWDTTSASPYSGSLDNLVAGDSIDVYFNGD